MIIGRNVFVTITTSNGEFEVLAKVDTGAYSSSIDSNFFKTLGISDNVFKSNIVKNVHGSESREVYKMSIIIKGVKLDSELNTFDRSDMKYKMILGRKDIAKLNAIVDVKKKEKVYIKTFEELNIKKAIIGGALAASVMTGCIKDKNLEKTDNPKISKTINIPDINLNPYGDSSIDDNKPKETKSTDTKKGKILKFKKFIKKRKKLK